ncbi:MAG TPA: OsmC family peroxiredoxin [Nitrospirae bacterium]|nr:OsmC family peroxiredoxin [Nitrospirota bacterium]
MSQEELKAAVMGVMEAFTKNPEAAKVVYRSKTELVENLRCKGTIRNFDPYTIDEPKDFGGGDAGPSPVEFLCMILGACQEILYAAYAASMDIKLDECKIDVKGNIDFRGCLGMDDNTPPGFSKIELVTHIKSSASEEALSQLVNAVEGRCPIYDSLIRPVEVVDEVFINGVKK